MQLTCVCKTQFDAEPNAENGWTAKCPNCDATLRIKPPKGSAPAKTDAQRVADKARSIELASCLIWLVVGIVQIVLVWTAAAGVWNIINAIMRLRSSKNIQADNPHVVGYFDERRIWLIVLAVVNLVLGGVIGVFLVAVDWYNRDYVLKNRTAFAGEEQQTTEPAPNGNKAFCSNCGAKLEGAAKFCANCGAKA